MQFTITLVASHAIVTSRPVYKLLDRLAGLPNPDRPAQAVMLVCVASIVTGYLNWAFTIIASALFIPFVCRRNPKADIRILVVGAYLGICTVWHGGLSASAPLILATPGNPLLEPTTGPPPSDRSPDIGERDIIHVVQSLVHQCDRHRRGRRGHGPSPASKSGHAFHRASGDDAAKDSGGRSPRVAHAEWVS